jgi:hypothetical protein
MLAMRSKLTGGSFLSQRVHDGAHAGLLGQLTHPQALSHAPN